YLSPNEFKQWLDAKKDVMILDTRNAFEMEYGTFENAVNLNLEKFTQFPDAIERLDSSAKEKPVVMFCTGGIRCEKASAVMLNQGYKQVYQLEGGILNYFQQCGGAHYQGSCFVFDERVALDSNLMPVVKT
ncbi:MAG: rhodanese-related sulfurtransferase, partial [Gammaproteobacteria bacterium]|nr:rhodanese-related sulfurtransferase [Gammaproteobacteria bacterium]